MQAKVNLAISVEKLAELIHDGHICVNDFTCLDGESKNQVWQLCLWCCNKKIHCNATCPSTNTARRAGSERRVNTIEIKTVEAEPSEVMAQS